MRERKREREKERENENEREAVCGVRGRDRQYIYTHIVQCMIQISIMPLIDYMYNV